MRIHIRHIRWLPVMAMGVLLLATFAPALTGQSPAGAQTKVVASLDPVQGLVQFHPADSPEGVWQTVVRRQLVGEDDMIRTDHLGMAYVRFFEGVETTILPNSVVRITGLTTTDEDTFEVTFDTLLGDTLNRVERAMDADARYEINTPSAVIVVRGTEFWTTATWLRETVVSALSGVVSVTGVDPGGVLGETKPVGPDLTLNVLPEGGLGEVNPIEELPQFPPPAPLAPETCGNGICEPDESDVCSVDCQEFPTCGNGICEYGVLEGPVTCPDDCVPEFRPMVLDLGPVPSATPVPTITPVSAPPTFTPAPTNVPAPVPCTLMSTERGVTVHVGPGRNRGVREYLTPYEIFPVLGWATANDGTLWWKIDSPPAPQAWVADEDVMTTGDCALTQVPEATPPPIVAPQPPAQPVPPPDSTATLVPTPAEVYISFVADKYNTTYGQCVTISWDVEGIREVYYMGQGVVGHGSRQECPYQTTRYTLQVVLLSGQSEYRYITISVSPY